MIIAVSLSSSQYFDLTGVDDQVIISIKRTKTVDNYRWSWRFIIASRFSVGNTVPVIIRN